MSNDLYPYTDIDALTDKILAMLPAPTEEDADSISFWLKYHSCEPRAAAEKIATETGLDCNAIFKLL